MSSEKRDFLPVTYLTSCYTFGLTKFEAEILPVFAVVLRLRRIAGTSFCPILKAVNWYVREIREPMLRAIIVFKSGFILPAVKRVTIKNLEVKWLQF